MGQYHYTVNLDKKEFLNPHKLGCGLKLVEQVGGPPGGVNDALHLLLAVSNGRGGGDFHTKSSFIGRWGGDRIAVVGDYAEARDLDSEHDADTICERCGDDGDYTRSDPDGIAAAGPPAHQGGRVEARANVVAEQAEILAQLESPAQLAHGSLAFADDGRRARCEQPAGQLLLTGWGARGEEKLEERAAAEQVEIVGVGVRCFEFTLPIRSGAGPLVADAGNSSLIERGGTLCAAA